MIVIICPVGSPQIGSLDPSFTTVYTYRQSNTYGDQNLYEQLLRFDFILYIQNLYIYIYMLYINFRPFCGYILYSNTLIFLLHLSILES